MTITDRLHELAAVIDGQTRAAWFFLACLVVLALAVAWLAHRVHDLAGAMQTTPVLDAVRDAYVEWREFSGGGVHGYPADNEYVEKMDALILRPDKTPEEWIRQGHDEAIATLSDLLGRSTVEVALEELDRKVAIDEAQGPIEDEGMSLDDALGQGRN